MKKNKLFLVALVFGLLLTGLIYLSINNEPEYPNLAYATQQAREITPIPPTSTQAAYWARVGGTDMVWSACVDGLNCDENMVAIYPDAGLVEPDWQYATAHPGRQVIWQGDSAGSVYENATITPQPPTVTPTVMPTETPVPVLDKCVRVVWDKGTVTQGLNLRNFDEDVGMGDNADGRSYLGPGFTFDPLDVVYVDGVGWAAKVANPSWYIFMSLDYKPSVDYAVFVECP